MWSAVNQDYLQDLINSNREEYPYYVAFTNTDLSTDYNYNSPSFYVYFSKQPINATGLYSYVFQDTPLVYSIISYSGSRYSTDARVRLSNGTRNLSISQIEFVYSNAEFESGSIQPDITATKEVTQQHFDGISLVIGIMLITALIVRMIKR